MSFWECFRWNTNKGEPTILGWTHADDTSDPTRGGYMHRIGLHSGEEYGNESRRYRGCVKRLFGGE